MKLQFNLLPDVKQEYLKTERTKKNVIMISLIASSISFFLLLFMITTVYVVNHKHLDDADKDITKYSKELKEIPNLDKILTVQNQLKSVADLHANKHVASRLYTYLPQVTPTNVCLGKVAVDIVNNSITANGTAESLKAVNTFIDTLKFTTYKLDNETKNAFPSVVESQFGLQNDKGTPGVGGASTACGGKPALATYGLTVQFDPALFSNTANIKLSVPSNYTTRSILDNPSSDLFTGQTNETIKQNSSSTSTQGGSQ